VHLQELQSKKADIQALAEAHGVSRIRVFGSVARGEQSASSDVDFLVNLPRGYDMFRQRIALMQKLSDFLQVGVDVVPEHELNKFIKQKVLKEAVDL
jgi:predicted nucleotidyltransferase